MELLSRNGKDMSLSRFVPGGKLGHRGKKLIRLGYGQAQERTHFNPGEKLGRLGSEQVLGRTLLRSWGDYEDVCCRLSALIKLMELARSWPGSSTLEKENKKSVFSERAERSHFARQPREIRGRW